MKYTQILLFILGALFSQSLFAAEKCQQEILLAAVDPVFDIEHVGVKNKLWTNPHEIPDNKIDDDHNGYIDDMHGWDVADSDADISIKFSDEYCQSECRKYGALSYRRRAKMATTEELDWLTKKEKDDPEIPKKWRGFINLIHGVGTVSVAIDGTQCVKWLGLKTSEDTEFQFQRTPAQVNNKGSRPTPEQLEKLAQETENDFLKPFQTLKDYTGKVPVRVSTHVYYMDGFKESFKRKVLQKLNYELDDETATKIERPHWKSFVTEARKVFTENPNVLFIFPTTNNGENVDSLEYFPMTQQLPNTLVVQASEGFIKPAVFTGYGMLADLAVHTIDITYATYGHSYMKGTATSLSVPLVANTALKMLEINPKLTAKELKQLLIKSARKVKSFAKANKNSAVLDSAAAFKAAQASAKKK